MPYQTPRSWQVGELVTASYMNQEIKENISAIHTFVGGMNITDNAILMGNGTSAISPANGISGHDSQPLLTISGAGATLELSETATTPDEVWKVKTTEASGDSYLQINKPDGGTALSFHKTGYQVAYADGVNAYYYNAAGSSEQVRFGASGISFNGGTNYLSAVPVPVAEGGTGASSLTDTHILMGRGTSAISTATGVTGSTSGPTLTISGSNPYLYLTNTDTTTGTWYNHAYPSGGITYYRLGNETRAQVIQWGSTGQQYSYTGTGTSAEFYNEDASVKYVSFGQHGISPHGSSNEQDHLDDYEYGNFSPVMFGYTTGNTGDSTYRITGGTGNYVKIGKLVFVHFRFDDFTVPSNATGGINVTMPFANALADDAGVPMLHSWDLASADYDWTIVYTSGSAFFLYDCGSGVAWSQEPITQNSGSGKYYWFSGTYYSAA